MEAALLFEGKFDNRWLLTAPLARSKGKLCRDGPLCDQSKWEAELLPIGLGRFRVDEHAPFVTIGSVLRKVERAAPSELNMGS